jgi:hypothetical protein
MKCSATSIFFCMPRYYLRASDFCKSFVQADIGAAV